MNEERMRQEAIAQAQYATEETRDLPLGEINGLLTGSLDRLGVIEREVREIADRLYGARPEPACDNATGSQGREQCVIYQLQELHERLDRIQAQIQRCH